MGALGAGLKYLEDSAKQQKLNQSYSSGKQNDGFSLSSLNPFVAPPTPTPTPQLSKEYIYAGSRMLAVEDAGANAAPPADLAVWRASTGYWYVMGGQGSAQTFYAWGGSGDKPVPGDFDGDGKTDFSIWRASAGTWYIVPSSTGVGTSITFGASSDQTAPADYDGDGKTDAAVFRAATSSSTATWYILRSSDSNWTSTAFGLGSDIPAPADYDGDGKADIAVWRGGGTKTFYFLRSSDNIVQGQALSQDGTPVSADYDGDGKADCAVKNGNVWMIQQSSTNSSVSVTWQTGQSGSEQAVQNDYDGDGKVDIAVWNSSNGHWYIRQSSLLSQNGGLRDVAWGQTGDTPVPAFYRR